MPTENVWIVPTAANLDIVMSQIVLNAAEIPLAQSTGGNTANQRSLALMQIWINTLRSAVLVGGKTPVSQLSNSVPPEAEMHAYILTVNSMVSAKPNMNSVVIGLNGGILAPFNDLVKRANAWVDAVRKGLFVPSPSYPAVTGNGTELAPVGGQYNLANTIGITGLYVGYQYYWQPGPNETSFNCGSTTLTGAGSFYASATTATLTGTSGNIVTGSLQQAQLAFNQATGGNVVGLVDMTTDGPYYPSQQPAATIGTL